MRLEYDAGVVLRHVGASANQVGAIPYHQEIALLQVLLRCELLEHFLAHTMLWVNL